MTEPVKIPCRCCGQDRELDEYRVFKSPLRIDFCHWCEKKEGTITLYRRYSSYGTPEIIQAVFSAERTPVGKRSAEQTRLLVPAKEREQPKDRTALIELELKRRELCRRSLIYYTTTFDPTYTPGWVHHDIARRLEKFMLSVELGEAPRLMIFMPPRLGKSRLASDMFPSWMLGHHPEWPIIASSYGQDLPVGFSRNIRDRIKDAEYQAVFDSTRVRADSQAVESWTTTKGGGYKASGVGVGISGFGYKVGIIDDPIKDYEAAQSQTIREATWGWYQSVFRTRAAPGAGIICIMTRWHDSDPAGKLIEAEKQLRVAGVPEEQIEAWEVVSYPALAEHDEYLMEDGSIRQGEPAEGEVPKRLLRRAGEALHSERYSRNDLLKVKNGMAPGIWSALYQQNPTPDDGDYFQKSQFRYRILDEEYIKIARVFITADYALGKKQRSDWTVFAVFALTANDDLYVLDVLRGRWKSPKIIEGIVGLIEKWKPEVYAGEQGQIHSAIWPLVQPVLEAKRLFVTVDDSLQPIQDKEARARPLQARMSMGKLFFSYAASERPTIVEEVERELLRFPNGAHDDIVDALAWGARLALVTTLPTGFVPKKVPSWRDELAKELRADQRGKLSHMAV